MWFLIAQTIFIKTGAACEALDDFRDIPLSCPKSLWEARTQSAWQSEYELYKSMRRLGMNVLGDLIDACRQSDIESNRAKLDTWNSKADNLGVLLRLSTSMV